MRRNRMLNFKYAVLLLRLAAWKLRLRGRLKLDGIAFIGPGCRLEVGPNAVLELGRWSWLGHGCKIRCHEGRVAFGAKSVMGQECTISAYQSVSIGRECVIADRVMLIDFDHGTVEVGPADPPPGDLQARRAGSGTTSGSATARASCAA